MHAMNEQECFWHGENWMRLYRNSSSIINNCNASILIQLDNNSITMSTHCLVYSVITRY